SLGSQNAVAAGGRYDGLIRDLGGPELPGIGFAMGVERLVLLLQNSETVISDNPQLFIAALGEKAANDCFRILTDLQRNNIRAEMDYSGKSLKAQLRRADKIKARFALIIGEDELAEGKAQLRNMSDGSQQEIALNNIGAALSELIG
nr:histidine--tRNA ligase [Desulfuromonadales bacterium]